MQDARGGWHLLLLLRVQCYFLGTIVVVPVQIPVRYQSAGNPVAPRLQEHKKHGSKRRYYEIEYQALEELYLQKLCRVSALTLIPPLNPP